MDHRTILCSYCNKPLQVNGDPSEQTVDCPTCRMKTTVIPLSNPVEELDFYPLEKPYSFISILKEKDTLKKRYVILEPVLSKDDEEILLFLKDTIVKTLDVRLDELGEKVESYLIKSAEDILTKYEIVVDGVSWEKILYYLKKRFLGYDDIEPLMKDPYIEDISCDGAQVPIFVYQRRFGSLETNVLFSNADILAKFVVKLAQKCGKHISVSDPMLDATMPDGSRIQMTLSGEVTTRGSTFTIRKFRADPITPVDLIAYSTFSRKMIAYLWMAVEHGFNALISGGTASGKTSALNALALFIPRESKIVSIEETREINLPHPNWIPGVTRSGFGEVINDRMVGEIDLFDLMKAALRQRPEYILVGEIRGKEAYVLFQAMATGHTTYSTVHADSTQALIHRLEGKPINIPRTMLQSLDIVLLMRNQKSQDKQQRRCMKVVELLNVDNETNEVLTNSVFEWDPQLGDFIYTGKSYILEQVRSQLDMSADDMTEELGRRAKILEWMEQYNIREFIDVSNILAKYAETPDKVLELTANEPEKMEEEIKETLFTHKSEYDSLLDDPEVIKRNEDSRELKAHKKEKNSIIGSFFVKKPVRSSGLFNQKQKKEQEPQINSKNIEVNPKKENDSSLTENLHVQSVTKIKNKPAAYFSKIKVTEDSETKKSTVSNEMKTESDLQDQNKKIQQTAEVHELTDDEKQFILDLEQEIDRALNNHSNKENKKESSEPNKKSTHKKPSQKTTSKQKIHHKREAKIKVADKKVKKKKRKKFPKVKFRFKKKKK